MDAVGDEAPHQPRTERPGRTYGDNHPETARARRLTAKSDRLMFLGRDEAGMSLEVMAIETNRGLLIIHAMAMRTKYSNHLRGDDDDTA